MEKHWHRRERRLQAALERLGTNTPRCVQCGEDYPHALERHHIAGRSHDEATCIVCRNCHRKLSDMQKDHPWSPRPNDPDDCAAQIANFLLGLADLFELLIEKLREFGMRLLAPNAEGTRKAGGHDV